jgi:hypothetical protein
MWDIPTFGPVRIEIGDTGSNPGISIALKANGALGRAATRPRSPSARRAASCGCTFQDHADRRGQPGDGAVDAESSEAGLVVQAGPERGQHLRDEGAGRAPLDDAGGDQLSGVWDSPAPRLARPNAATATRKTRRRPKTSPTRPHSTKVAAKARA